MKNFILIATALFLIVTFSPAFLYAQQQSGPQQGWYCPWMGQNGGGPYRGGGCCGWWSTAPFNQGKPISKDQAKLMLDNYLRSRNDPDLKLGDLTDKGDFFEATITAKDGSVIQKIQVDKNSGWFRNIS